MSKTGISKEQVNDARRQGQFEGRIESKLDNIHSKVDTIVTAYANLEGRLREAENKIITHQDFFVTSAKAHEDMDKRIDDTSSAISDLVNYQSKVRGIIIAASVICPILASIITGFILKTFFK